MITEDYVSFDVAKLLKEKGFNEEIETLITPTGKIYFLDENSVKKIPHNTIRNSQINTYSNDVSCPTLQMAMKWLREVHNVFIDISSRFSKNADKDVCFSYSCKKLIDTYKSSYEFSDGELLNYEQAVKDAILFCLKNLI